METMQLQIEFCVCPVTITLRAWSKQPWYSKRLIDAWGELPAFEIQRVCRPSCRHLLSLSWARHAQRRSTLCRLGHSPVWKPSAHLFQVEFNWTFHERDNDAAHYRKAVGSIFVAAENVSTSPFPVCLLKLSSVALMAPRAQVRKRPSGAALPVRKPVTTMVSELVTALKRSFSEHRNEADAASMTKYVSLGLTSRTGWLAVILQSDPDLNHNLQFYSSILPQEGQICFLRAQGALAPAAGWRRHCLMEPLAHKR